MEKMRSSKYAKRQSTSHPERHEPYRLVMPLRQWLLGSQWSKSPQAQPKAAPEQTWRRPGFCLKINRIHLPIASQKTFPKWCVSFHIFSHSFHNVSSQSSSTKSSPKPEKNWSLWRFGCHRKGLESPRPLGPLGSLWGPLGHSPAPVLVLGASRRGCVVWSPETPRRSIPNFAKDSRCNSPTRHGSNRFFAPTELGWDPPVGQTMICHRRHPRHTWAGKLVVLCFKAKKWSMRGLKWHTRIDDTFSSVFDRIMLTCVLQ